MIAKLLAYHNGKYTAVSTWRNGTLSGRRVFPADAEGIAGFAAHLGAHPGTPLHFLVDVIEEDFRLDTVPHLLGRSRAALVNRKLGQVFRTEIYRHSEFQGRDSEGRRDDRLLLSALSNEEGLKPWLDAALEKKTPIAGVYSVPLLSQPLAVKLGLAGERHLLLVTRQEVGTSGMEGLPANSQSGSLRQSYFQDGLLKFSRLTYAAAADLSGLAAMVNEESAKIQQYLNNTRLLPRDEALHIHFLGTGEELDVLEGECDGGPLRRFELRDLADAAAALGLPPAPDHPAAEALFLQFLARHRIPNHYASPRETRYWRLDRTALAMKSSGIALVIFGGASAALNIAHGLTHLGRAGETEQQAIRIEARTQAIRAAFPTLPIPPDALKQTVELANHLSSRSWTPEPLMNQVSQALASQPHIRLERLQWALSADPNLKLGSEEAAAPQPEGESAPPPAPGGGLYEVALMEGEVSPFVSYRHALEQVEALAAKLKANPGLEAVPVTLPIETDPKAELKGSVDEEGKAASATFSLRLTRRIESP